STSMPLYVFFLMIRRPPRSTLFPTRRSSDLDLGVSKYWVVASNMTGATAGMLSPQNIAVATGSINREGDEGEILKETVKWGGLYLVVCCVFLYVVGLIAGMI